METTKQKSKWQFPFCIVCHRSLEWKVVFYSDNFLKNGYEIDPIDWSGSRVVMMYQPINDDENPIDIPENIFNACKQFVFSDVTEDLLFIRIEDPGLGIIIPEIDYPKTKKGELIDGVITNKGIHLAKGGK